MLRGGDRPDFRREWSRPDWFQGREIAEALAIRIDAADGQFEKALGELEQLSRSLRVPTSTMPRG